MGRSSRRKQAKEKKPCCLGGLCNSHVGRPAAAGSEVVPATVANRPAAAITTSSASEIAGRTRSGVSSGPNVAKRAAASVPERLPPVAPGGARRKRKNKPKPKTGTGTTVKVEKQNLKELSQPRGLECFNAGSTGPTTKKKAIPGQKRGPTEDELLEIRRATGMVNFLTHFLQFTVDFDENKDFSPMTMFAKGFMREMLMKSKFFLPMLESLKEMWVMNDGLKDEEYCNVKGVQLFIKWRQFGLLFRRSVALRREWEACVLRFGLKDRAELRNALGRLDRSINEVSRLFEGNRECRKSIKRFLMQRPELMMPRVFLTEADRWEEEQLKSKRANGCPNQKKRERSRSCEGQDRLKMEREKKAKAKTNGCSFSHGGDNGSLDASESEYLCESSGSDDCDDVFKRLFCGSADNIDPRMLVAVVELMQDCATTYGPSKSDEFLSFSKAACRVVAEHLIDKASFDF